MKTVACDLCGQPLTEEEVKGTVHLPSDHGEPGGLVMWPQLRRLGHGVVDAC